MALLETMFVRASAIVVVAGCAAQGGAQCLDWMPGFGAAQNGIDGQVHAMTVFDDGGGPQLYVGGNFGLAGGLPASGIARWNGFDWSSVGNGLGTVMALAVYDDGGGPELYAAGQFRFVEGVEFNYIAKWDGSAWVQVGTGLGNNAACLLVHDDGNGPELFVGGSFTSAGGSPTDHIASWNGTRWRTWNGGPSARTGHAIAYDAARENVVFFSGTTNGGHTGVEPDTWTLEGSQWTLAATSGAGARYGHVMAYDSLRERVVVSGGRGTYDFTNPNSGWNGSSWTTLPGSLVTPARLFYQMVYDEARDRMVIFGGQNDCCSGVYLNDTWEYDGTSWTQVMTPASPPSRWRHGMAYDSARQRVVLFGGRRVPEGDLNDTWEYDGVTWAQVAATGPSARANHAMAYDSLRSRVVMFAGTSESVPQHDTWAWDGTTWTMIDAGNASWPFRTVPMVYDAVRDIMVQRLDNQTWIFNGATWSIQSAGGINGEVSCMAAHDDGTGPALYVGGTFTSAGGASANGLARWNGTAWSDVGVGGNGNVATIAEYDGDLYVGGTFSNAGNMQANNIARWDGAAWSSVGTGGNGAGVDSPVSELFVADLGDGDRLFVGGTFTHAEAVPASRVVTWNGASWMALGTGLNDGANARVMTTYDDGTGMRLYVGGLMTSAGGQPSRNIAAYGSTCSAPVITFPPLSTEAVFGQPIVFQVTAIGTGPLVYEWRRNNVTIDNEPGRIFGATTDRLEIQWWSINDIGTYDVVVSNKYGSETSEPATLTIPLAGVAGPVDVTRVLFPPEPVPGSPGEVFTSLSSPLVSSTGEVTFGANLAGNSINRWDAGTLEVAFRAGQQAPGLPEGFTFAFQNSGIGSFRTYVVAEDSRMAFDADLAGPGVSVGNRRGIWYADTEGGALVARAGSSAPGAAPFLFHREMRLGGIGDNGVVAFQSLFSLIPNGDYEGAGIWSWSPTGGLALHARTGFPAPGTTASFLFITEPPRVNAVGDIAFVARLDSNESGLWRGQPGSPSLIMKTGDPAPGYPSTHSIDWVSLPLLNDQGHMLIDAGIAAPGGFQSRAIYLSGTGGPTLLLRMHDPAPGAASGQTFLTFATVAFNNSGHALIYSSLNGTGPRWGVWFFDGTSLLPVILAGTTGLPGAPANMRFEEFQAGAMNDSDQIILNCQLRGTTTHTAVFGWTEDQELFPIVVPGTQIELTEGTYRTAFNAHISGAIGGESTLASRAINADGRVVFQTQLAGVAGQGVFVGQFDDFLGGYLNCPIFTGEPSDTEVGVGKTAVLSASAVGAGELSFQWRKNTKPLADDGRITGSTTDTLFVADAMQSDEGTYDLVVSNDCGSATSAGAEVTVFCPADWNRSGAVNSQDFFDFLSAFFQSLPTADFNEDRAVNSQDFFDFLNAFFGGC